MSTALWEHFWTTYVEIEYKYNKDSFEQKAIDNRLHMFWYMFFPHCLCKTSINTNIS